MRLQTLAISEWPSLTDAEAAQAVGGAKFPLGPFWKKAAIAAIGAILETAIQEWRRHAQGAPRRQAP